MWKGMLYACLIVVFSCEHIMAQQSETGPDFSQTDLPPDQRMMHMDMALTGIERALQFLFSHVEQINLDGIIGPRQVEGAVNALLIRYWQRMPSSLVTRLMRVRNLANMIGEYGNRVVNQKMPFYYSRDYHLIQAYSWSMYRAPDKLNYSLIWTQDGKQDSWSEESCDNCLHEFLNKTQQGNCVISPICWNIVSSDILSGYSLVHQVIYILTGINSGCLTDLKRLSRITAPDFSIDNLLRTLCTRVFIEAENLAASRFPLEYRDLFMEQIGICGGAGFIDQLRPSWLPVLLSWQAPNGCFYRFEDEKLSLLNFDPLRYGAYRRRKRAEKYINSAHGSEFCLSHRTSVALAALQSYLTRLIEVLYGQWPDWTDLSRS